MAMAFHFPKLAQIPFSQEFIWTLKITALEQRDNWAVCLQLRAFQLARHGQASELRKEQDGDFQHFLLVTRVALHWPLPWQHCSCHWQGMDKRAQLCSNKTLQTRCAHLEPDWTAALRVSKFPVLRLSVWEPAATWSHWNPAYLQLTVLLET